jgi:hypothetical protein
MLIIDCENEACASHIEHLQNKRISYKFIIRLIFTHVISTGEEFDCVSYDSL